MKWSVGLGSVVVGSAVIGTVVLGVLAAPVEAQDDAGFVSLTNGRDLSGWKTGPDNAWVVENGELTVRREFDGQEHNQDYLWTTETYGDFVLELEFKVAENTNSGIFIRTSDLKDPVYTGIEIQVANSHGRTELSRTGTAGAIYDALAPSANALKPPGEWNQCVVRCEGPRVRVTLNGQRVVDLNLDDWSTPHENPDGSRNKFATALKDFSRTGYVGLQDHGRPVWYRKIRVKRLD